jgi:hypothetical protein
MSGVDERQVTAGNGRGTKLADASPLAETKLHSLARSLHDASAIADEYDFAQQAICGRLALPAEGDCLPESPWLGWAFTPGADCDATPSLAADIRKASGRAAWFMVPVAMV